MKKNKYIKTRVKAKPLSQKNLKKLIQLQHERKINLQTKNNFIYVEKITVDKELDSIYKTMRVKNPSVMSALPYPEGFDTKGFDTKVNELIFQRFSDVSKSADFDELEVDFVRNELDLNSSILANSVGEKDIPLVGFDTEYFFENDFRWVLSYQFTILFNGICRRFIVFPRSEMPFSLSFDFIPFLHSLFPDYVITGYTRYNRSDNDDSSDIKFSKFDVILVSHFSQVDVSCFLESDYILSNLTDLGFSKFPIIIGKSSKNRNGRFSMSVRVFDTLRLASHKSPLEEIGVSLGLHKVDISPFSKDKMDVFLENDINFFIEYALRDSDITCFYYYKLYNNKSGSPTIVGAGVNYIKPILHNALGLDISDNEGFKRLFRGVHTVKEKEEKYNNLFLRDTEQFLTPAVANVLSTARQAYVGGYNASMILGITDSKTYDVDLKSAYNSAMCLIDEIDFSKKDIVKKNYIGELDDVDARTLYFEMISGGAGYGYADITFPEDCLFPNVFQKSLNGLVNVLVNESVAVDLVTVVTAYFLGAKIKFVASGFNLLHTNNSYALSHGIKDIVCKKELSKKYLGSKAVETLVIKLIGNGLYGKTAQNLVGKNTTNNKYVFREVYGFDDNDNKPREDLNPSALTSPHHACMSTSIVRNILCVTMQELTNLGYDCYSVTTDGFITDAPLNVINNLSHPILDWYKRSRLFLTDGKDDFIWEVKHENEFLLNISTRINVGKDSDNLPGVFACVGYKGKDKTKFISDYLESRHNKNGYKQITQEFYNIKDVIEKQLDFIPYTKQTNLRLVYDMKRKPLEVTDEIFNFEGKDYLIECYKTSPFETFTDFENTKYFYDCKSVDYPIKKIVEEFEVIKKIDRHKPKTNSELHFLYCLRNSEEYGKYFNYLNLDEAADDLKVFFKDTGVKYPITVTTLKNAGRKNRYKKIYDEECRHLLERYKKYLKNKGRD